ncbi:MAG TPA: hypothetical protein DD638_03585 [Pasteurellaceae bacterium]|nr:hypothetical protein [Pasteurellaceae bacterium]
MKYIKWIISLCLILPALSACYYADGCFHSPQLVSCVNKGEQWPYIALFQKTGQFGRTDSEQRWKDVSRCGGIDISKENNEFEIKGYRDERRIVIPEVVKEFERCMLSHGYERLYNTHCGTQHPKWDEGKCNL